MGAAFIQIRMSLSALRVVLLAAASIAVLSAFLWVQRDFARAFLLAHNPWRDHAAVVALSGAVSRYGMSALCLLVLAAVAASFRSPAFRPVRPVLLVVLMSFSAAAIASSILKEVLGRARPIAELAGQLNAAGTHDSASFPSGHAAKSVALALPLVLMVPAASAGLRLIKLALLLVAGLVCYSRIMLGAHYLSDVLAGVALALACVPVAVAGANLIYARGKVTPEKLEHVVKRASFVLLGLTVLLPFL